MPPERLVLLSSDSGVVLSKVTLAESSPNSQPITTYLVEIASTKEMTNPVGVATRMDLKIALPPKCKGHH
jgi:hypothetical protein